MAGGELGGSRGGGGEVVGCALQRAEGVVDGVDEYLKLNQKNKQYKTKRCTKRKV